jgi:HK97 family phage prohead protease
MVIRTKNGDFQAENSTVLLDYLGIAQKSSGVHKVAPSKDGMGDVVLIASVPFQVDKEESSGGVPWTFSTFDLDRCGERIDPLGWDFSHYIKNPVIQWAHCYQIPAIGRAENISVDEKGLHGSLIFNDKSFDAFGWGIGERVKNGVLRAGSVGFRVIEIEIPSKEDSKDGTSLIFRKQELLEFSVCNVPANPFALSQMKNEKGKMKNDEDEELKAAASMPPEANGSIVIPFWNNLISNI